MAWFLPALEGAGSAIGSAASAVGGGLADAASAVGGELGALGSSAGSAIESAVPGLSSVGQGLQSLFGAPSEAGYLTSLGQAVPAGVDLVGPSAGTLGGPGFASGFLQGLTGTLSQYASPSAGTSLGQGLGQLLQAAGGANVKAPGGLQAPQPVVNLSRLGHLLGPEVSYATAPTGVGPGPIMSLLHGIIGSI